MTWSRRTEIPQPWRETANRPDQYVLVAPRRLAIVCLGLLLGVLAFSGAARAQGALTNGQNHTGTIGLAEESDTWSFTASAGDHITLTVTEVGADTAFVPFIRLINPTGGVVAQNWGTLAAGLSTTAVTGTYTVEVMSNDTRGDATGGYVVRLANAPRVFTVPSGDEGGGLSGQNRSGVIERGDIDQWNCTVVAGVLQTFTITETGGDTAFVPFIRLVGPTGAVIGQNWGATTATITLTPAVAGDYRVLVLSNDAGGDAEGSYMLSAPSCQPSPLPNPRRDTAVDFGQYGLWMRYNQGDATERWQQLDPHNPGAMATGDLDGDGRTDLIVTFPGAGVRVWMNDTEWVQLHALDASEIVTGDLDGDGHDDAVLSLPGVGLQIWYNNTSWTPLHSLTSAGLATGNLDNDVDGRDDLVVNFEGHGVWRYMNNSSWVQLHPLSATDMTTGNVDGSGGDDLVLNFPGYGVWTYFNNNSWSQLHALNSAAITLGNIDGDAAGRKDVIVTFAGYGVWSWMNNANWVRRHPLDARPIASADLDASGREDLLLSFNSYGIWLWMNNVSFTQLHPLVPDGYVTGRFDDH